MYMFFVVFLSLVIATLGLVVVSLTGENKRLFSEKERLKKELLSTIGGNNEWGGW